MAENSILIYDGDCAFCTTWVVRLQKFLPRFPKAATWQSSDIAALGLTEHDVTHFAWLVVGRHRFRGHEAFAALLLGQRSFAYRFAGQLLVTHPFAWAARAGYAFIARFRHRLPGGAAACALPQSR